VTNKVLHPGDIRIVNKNIWGIRNNKGKQIEDSSAEKAFGLTFDLFPALTKRIELDK
jgi:hypothetical protein